MSVAFTGTFQGSFISNGVARFIPLPTDVDYMYVKNRTVSYAAGAGTGAEFFWQRGMTDGRGTIYTKTAATNALTVGQIVANTGFYLTDQSLQVSGPVLTLTAIATGASPVVSTTTTASLNNGDVVRIFNTTGAQQLGGLDFTIGSIVAGTSFTLAFMRSIVAGTGGTFRKIPSNPIFYPRRRFITKISNATQALVTLSVTHGYVIGQKIRFIIPVATAIAYGMTELNGVDATIIAIGVADVDGVTNTITVDIDTSGFTAFAFPLTVDVGFTPAQVIPVGENTAYALNPVFMTPPIVVQDILSDATVNTAQFGMLLMAGTGSPAGVNLDVIDWIAGKSWNI